MITLAIISYCALSVTLVQCADNNGDGSATTLTRDFNNDGLGPYNFLFETSNGIKQSEKSNAIATKNVEELLIEVVGSYSYPGTDGKIYEVRYVANATGFYPSGDHIKVPAVVPWPSSNTLDEVDTSLSDSGSGNLGVMTSSDQGQVSIVDTSGDKSISTISTNSEVSVQNSGVSNIQLNTSSSGNVNTDIVSSNVGVVTNTYIPPPDTTYLPPHVKNNNELLIDPNIPKNINHHLLFSENQPQNPPNIHQLSVNSNQISENQKREAKYEITNPDSKMNQFANPANIVYFILKPQGFAMPS